MEDHQRRDCLPRRDPVPSPEGRGFRGEVIPRAALAPRSKWAVLKRYQSTGPPLTRQGTIAPSTETGEFLKNGFYLER